MPKRKIVRINEDKCTGCGQCIPNCPEGALQVIDGKARLVSDLFCDGLGACVGHCPEDAMTVEEREAEPYDEAQVMENIVRAGPNTIRAHLTHLKEHGACDYYNAALAYLEERGIPVPESRTLEPSTPDIPSSLACGCPGSSVRELKPEARESGEPARRASRLRNWPIQLMLMPVNAPYLKGADLLIAADCAGASDPNFHENFVNGRILIIACPKLDDADFYQQKLAAMFKANSISSVMVLHMTVPCCFGLVQLVQAALKSSGKRIPFSEVTLDVDGRTKHKVSP